MLTHSIQTNGVTRPLGWKDFDSRTRSERDLHERIVNGMEPFRITGVFDSSVEPAVGTKVLLTDTWKHPAVVARLGQAYPGIHQITGSCVGAGGGNMLASLLFLQIIRGVALGDFVVPFWLLPYGRSRYDEGDRGPGEGSMGSSFAQAVKEDGVLDARMAGLPSFTWNDGLIWGQATEMKWSDGGAISPDWLTQSRLHLVQTASPLNSAAQIRDAILNGYPVTFAGIDWCQPGTETLQGTGADQVVIGNFKGRGGHQRSIHNYFNHPQLGPLYYIPNQWGTNVYKTDPQTGLGCGAWELESEIDKRAKSGNWEVYAFSGLQGFPAIKPETLIF